MYYYVYTKHLMTYALLCYINHYDHHYHSESWFLSCHILSDKLINVCYVYSIETYMFIVEGIRFCFDNSKL